MRGGSFGTFPFFIVMEQEIWKPVKGWEKYYEVSNKARVRTLPREIITKDGRRRKVNARIKSVYVGKRGYYCVNLQANGKRKVAYLHRLIMDAFVENTENKPCIDHIDDDQTDNRACNLQWCTHKFNNSKEHHRLAESFSQKGKILTSIRKPIVQLSTNGDLIQIFPSMTDADFGYSNRIILEPPENFE